MAEGTTTVYQYFASTGALIYVGVTDRGVRRLHEHAESKPWWTLATGCTLEHYATRELALAREQELIERFRPPYNHQHNPERSIPIEHRAESRLRGAKRTVREDRGARSARRAPVTCRACSVRPAATGGTLCLVCHQAAIPESQLATVRAAGFCVSCNSPSHLSARQLCRSCESRRDNAMRKDRQWTS